MGSRQSYPEDCERVFFVLWSIFLNAIMYLLLWYEAVRSGNKWWHFPLSAPFTAGNKPGETLSERLWHQSNSCFQRLLYWIKHWSHLYKVVQEVAVKRSSFFRHRDSSTKSQECFGVSSLYSLLGLVLQNRGPEGNCFVKCLWMVFIPVAAVWLYADLIYSHVLNFWIIRHWSSAQAFYVLLHFPGNIDNIISAGHFVTHGAKEIFTCVSHPTI